MGNFRSSALALCLAAVLLPACGGGSSSGVSVGDPAPAPVVSPSAPSETPAAPTAPVPQPASAPADSVGSMQSKLFEPSHDDFPNPERGFYHWVDLFGGRDYRYLRGENVTLGFASVSLRSYRQSPLPQGFLDQLSTGLAGMQRDGLKIILRFKYSNGLSDADAPKAWILEHIRQLTPVIRAHADVIAVMQAGFIGAWGEWHESHYGLDNPADRSEILRALLTAVPSRRFIQVRRPAFKRETTGSTALSPSEAFTGTSRARVGHHNDAFLASETDQGTYVRPVETDKAWLISEADYVPVGGECNTYNPPLTDGPQTLEQCRRFRFSFLSRSYGRSVVSAWRSSGWYSRLSAALGYRFRLLEMAWPTWVRAGAVAPLRLTLRNEGCAAAYNERPVYAVITGHSTWHAVRLEGADPRTWKPGEDVTLAADLPIPAGLAEGEYTLSLWMPDPADALRDRPDYAVRLANAGIWDSSTGYHRLTSRLVVVR